MNNFINALKNIPRRGQHNFVKILCLGVGFALASVLIAKLWYEHEYDTCYPDHDRIYRISEVIQVRKHARRSSTAAEKAPSANHGSYENKPLLRR